MLGEKQLRGHALETRAEVVPLRFVRGNDTAERTCIGSRNVVRPVVKYNVAAVHRAVILF